MGQLDRSGWMRAHASPPADPEIYVDELNHRVSNYAQLTVGLVASRARAAEHPETRRELLELAERLAALWEAPRRAMETRLVEVSTMLSERLSALLLAQERKDLRGFVEGSNLVLPLDIAGPLNLAVNEALLNCLKHAFPEGRPGRIVVKVEQVADHGGALVSVSDDGIGLAFGAGPETDARGGAIMRRLAEQMGAAVETVSEPRQGTTVSFRLPPVR